MTENYLINLLLIITVFLSHNNKKGKVIPFFICTNNLTIMNKTESTHTYKCFNSLTNKKIIMKTEISILEITASGADKKYRKMLSEAQNAGQVPKRSKAEKWYLSKIKQACNITGFASQHPETIKVLDEILNRCCSDAWGRPYWMSTGDNKSARDVVKIFN